MSSITATEVARYYAKSELSKLLESESAAAELSSSVDSMSEAEVLQLCEGLSVPFRLNWVWWILANPTFTWSLRQVPVEDVHMTTLGQDPLSDIIESPEINNNPLKLKEFLLNKFNQEDFDSFSNFRPDLSKKILFPRVMLRQRQGKLMLLDGSHRFIEMLLRGQSSVEAYVGVSSDESSSGVPVSGPGGFYSLKRLYLNSSKPEQESIFAVLCNLAEHSPKAEQYIKRLWIDEADDDAIKSAGKKVLEQLSKEDL